MNTRPSWLLATALLFSCAPATTETQMASAPAPAPSAPAPAATAPAPTSTTQATTTAQAATARAAQVQAGAAVFAKSCQGCHGDKLQGNRAPTLLGADFLKKYPTIGDLHGKISKTMPRNAPATLSETEYLAVTAFILSQNSVNAGDKAITTADFSAPIK